MLWLWIIVGTSVAGLVMVAALAWWLWGKVRLLGRELTELGNGLAEATATLSAIGIETD